MQIENITGIRLTARRTLQNKRYLTISHSLLRQIIINDKCITAGISDIFADGHSRKRRVIAHGCRIRSGSHNNYSVVKCAMLTQSVNSRGNRRSLLSDSHVYAIDRLPCLKIFPLVDDSVNSDCSLTYLAVSDDELTLSASYGHHSVHCLDTGLQRLVHRLTENHTRSLTLKRHLKKLSGDRSATVNWFAKHVDNAAEHPVTDFDRCDITGTLHTHSFGHLIDIIHKNHANIALLKIKRDTCHTILKLHQLICLDFIKTINMGYTVAHLKHFAGLFKRHLAVDVVQLLA